MSCYEAYHNDEKLATLWRQLSWSHNRTILGRCQTGTEREFYLRLCVHDHLSTRELDRQISASVYERTMLSQEKIATLSRQIGDKAKEVFRDTYYQ